MAETSVIFTGALLTLNLRVIQREGEAPAEPRPRIVGLQGGGSPEGSPSQADANLSNVCCQNANAKSCEFPKCYKHR